MKFKFTKSDLTLVVLYFLVGITVNLMEYANYESRSHFLIETILWVSSDLICIFLIIFLILPYYLPKAKYIQLVISCLGVFFILGIIMANILCYVGNCQSDVNNLDSYSGGLTWVVESFSIPGLFLIGKKFFEAQVNLVKMEKERKESELLRLNAQIDPHFLFNNLNTIDSLIDTNPQVAKIYLHKLSYLYRYLISTKDQEVVELNEELEFAQNYIYLIQYRFGDAFQFEIQNMKEEQEISFVPPGALQTLLENIVKHNQASTEKPIITTIKISENSIVIRNNLVKKRKAVDSTGIGLTNLHARYKLLSDTAIQIEQTEDFIVTLPLIKQVD